MFINGAWLLADSPRIGVLLAIPAIPLWNIENAAFQVYLIGVNALILFGIYRKKLMCAPAHV